MTILPTERESARFGLLRGETILHDEEEEKDREEEDRVFDEPLRKRREMHCGPDQSRIPM